MEQILNNEPGFLDADFKDELPLKTVEKIKNILHSHGIQTTETWNESSVPYCHSLRVSVVGTTFGTNGKGITKEFALASGYGELMERLQLGYIGSDNVQKDGNYSLNNAQRIAVPAQDLLAKNRKWYEALSENQQYFTDQKFSPEHILMQYADADGNVLSTPYFCLSSAEKVYFPTALRNAIYGTNGCAAGNTIEEAIVQAISEIVERHHQLRLYHGNMTPPDVPEDIIKKCDVAYKIISFLRNNGFRVIVKDCSLSQKFPVIGVCIINISSGRYHTHFGAYPLFEIALERALTESFQGRPLSKIAAFDDFRYDDPNTFNLNVLVNELVKGVSEKFPSFFVGAQQSEFNNDMGFSGKNNKELLIECVEYFKEKGLDIIIRDGSCLGFPTCQVLIPGYSEVFPHRLSPKHNDLRYISYSKKVLRNPSEATMDDMISFLMHLTQTAKTSKSLSDRHGFSANAALSLDFSAQDNAYMMSASLAYVYYSIGRFEAVIKCIDQMLENPNNKKEEYLICIKRYLSLQASKYSDLEIKALLELFHTKKTLDRLYSCLDLNRNPFEEFTLHCKGLCDDHCPLYSVCRQKKVNELAKIIIENTKALNFDHFAQKLQATLHD